MVFFSSIRQIDEDTIVEWTRIDLDSYNNASAIAQPERQRGKAKLVPVNYTLALN